MIRFVRTRLTYANVTASLALFIALGGSAYAALRVPNNSVGTAQLKKNAVISSKVKDHALRAVDFAQGQLPAGPRGPKGDRGAPGPSTGPAGGDLSGNYPDPSIAPSAVTPSKIGTIPGVLAYSSSGQTIANNMQVPLTFNSTAYGPEGMHSTTTNTNRLTAPIAGIYVVTGDVDWSANATGFRELDLDENGVTECTIAQCLRRSPDPNGTHQRIVAQLHLNAGDYVSLHVVQTSGGDLATNNQDFAMTWLGP